MSGNGGWHDAFVRVEVLIVANNAVVQNGLFHIEGGGWERVDAGLLPMTVQGVMAGIVTLGTEEQGELLPLHLEVGYLGQVVSSIGSIVIDGNRPIATPGVDTRVPFRVPFSLLAASPGVMKVSVLDDSRAELDATTFAIIDPIPDILS